MLILILIFILDAAISKFEDGMIDAIEKYVKDSRYSNFCDLESLVNDIFVGYLIWDVSPNVSQV